VAKLLTDRSLAECKPLRSIGYLQCLQTLQGELPRIELRDRIVFATRQYAKRQSTWFKKVSCDLTAKEFPLKKEEVAQSILNLWSSKCHLS
jgi:tRNA dimethylallyltransferase